MNPSWNEAIGAHLDVIGALREAGATLDAISDALLSAFHAGGRVYILGNGGSAADAQHIAAELLGRFKANRQALPAMALTTDSSTLTAVSNDYSFEQVFARQLEGLLRAGDVVWVLSTSGNSPNVLAAAKVARERGALVIGFTGGNGGKLAPLCDHVLRVPHDGSDRIQEGHLLAYHYICGRIEAAFSDPRR